MDYAARADAIRRPGPIDEASRDFRILVHYATLAASSDNTQPWLFRLHESAIEILPDLERRCLAVAPDDHHLYAMCQPGLRSREPADRRPDLVVRIGRGRHVPGSLRRPVDQVLS